MEQHKADLEVAILRKGMLSLYKNIEILNEDVECFKSKNYKIYSIDFSKIKTLDYFYEYLSEILEFPSYYRKNMDAFEDNLCELNLDGVNGGLLVFLRYDVFIGNFPNIAFDLLDIIASVARLYLIDGIKLITLIQTNETNLSLPKVGGYHIDSNSRESLIIT